MNINTIRADLVPVADLTYGKTPWDKLDREQLIYLLQSYHSVAQEMSSIIKVFPEIAHALPGFWREYIDNLQTSVAYVYSDWSAELQAFAKEQRTSVDWGGAETERYGCETEQLWRATMRPMGGALAFDHPDRPWKLCTNCGTCLSPGPKEGERASFCRQGTDEAPCSDHFRLFTWHDFRNPPAEEEVAA